MGPYWPNPNFVVMVSANAWLVDDIAASIASIRIQVTATSAIADITIGFCTLTFSKPGMVRYARYPPWPKLRLQITRRLS
jgi:hypothetical protein